MSETTISGIQNDAKIIHARTERVATHSCQHKSKSVDKDNVRIYFAHTICTYHTREEIDALRAIKRGFPNAILLNPSCMSSMSMRAYLDVVKQSDVVVFMAADDGMIGKGVYAEVKLAHHLGRHLYLWDRESCRFRSRFLVEPQFGFDWDKWARVRIWQNDLHDDENISTNSPLPDWLTNCSIVDRSDTVAFGAILRGCVDEGCQLVVFASSKRRLYHVYLKELSTIFQNASKWRPIVLPIVAKKDLCLRVAEGQRFRTNICVDCDWKACTFAMSEDELIWAYLDVPVDEPEAFLPHVLRSRLRRYGCPHLIIRELASLGDVLVTTRAFLTVPCADTSA